MSVRKIWLCAWIVPFLLLVTADLSTGSSLARDELAQQTVEDPGQESSEETMMAVRRDDVSPTQVDGLVPIEGEESDPIWFIDGVPFSDIPEHLRLMAYMRQIHTTLVKCHGRLRSTTSLCQTSQCTDLMKQYEDWRQQNGFGIASGRWG